jgi:hypothetical protein
MKNYLGRNLSLATAALTRDRALLDAIMRSFDFAIPHAAREESRPAAQHPARKDDSGNADYVLRIPQF